jgi:hypothetical protein
MSIDVRASGNDFQLWHVQLGGGVVRTLSLDELDDAFQAGKIDERTLVTRAGSNQWATLGEIAGITEQPYSLAPLAMDIASSNVVIPPPAPPGFDTSFGTEELAVFRPKRRVGRALAAVATVTLIAAAAFGAKSYGIGIIKAKVASVTSLMKGKNAEGARGFAVAPPAVVEPAKPTTASTPPPAAVEDLPSSKPAGAVSIDSLPTASPPASSGDKKTKAPAKAKKRAAPAKARSKSSNDPTLKGSGQFDPLNGNL